MIKTLLNILLAEDDKDYHFLFEEALKEIPIAIHLATVKNGKELRVVSCRAYVASARYSFSGFEYASQKWI